MPDVMTALREGLPLSLLIDLVAAEGPDSERILAAEAPDVDLGWLPTTTG